MASGCNGLTGVSVTLPAEVDTKVGTGCAIYPSMADKPVWEMIYRNVCVTPNPVQVCTISKLLYNILSRPLCFCVNGVHDVILL